MTDTSGAVPVTLPARRGFERKLVVIVAMTALADWLLYGHPVGIAVVLTVVLLEAGMLLTNPVQADRREIAAAAGVLLLSLLPFVESPGVIAFVFLAAGGAYFVLAMTGAAGGSGRIGATGLLMVAGPFQVLVNLERACEAFAERGGAKLTANALVAWIVPVLLAGVFLALFVSANPLIESWFLDWNLRDVPSKIDVGRVIFWLTAIAVIWPFICVSPRYHAQVRALLRSSIDLPTATIPDGLLGDATIVRSLVLFNLLFVVETVLDVNYLWRGAALPGGMTYAVYAHRGAYPLIITALLAAAFVIVAMRPGSTAERSSLIRGLVLLWIGQNVMLVGSAALRLDLYIATYSLTYLRAAAFVWMLLVAIGLVLIVARIIAYRSNAWLISANLAALALVVYVCGFINFPATIATYNVAHCREISGKGETLDIDYVVSLGPQAIPALDVYIEHQAPGTLRQLVVVNREARAQSFLRDTTDWHAWSFRSFRLQQHLKSDANGEAADAGVRPASPGRISANWLPAQLGR
jgi:hypothetical protein